MRDMNDNDHPEGKATPTKATPRKEVEDWGYLSLDDFHSVQFAGRPPIQFPRPVPAVKGKPAKD
jgi:hypothetical protein